LRIEGFATGVTAGRGAPIVVGAAELTGALMPLESGRPDERPDGRTVTEALLGRLMTDSSELIPAWSEGKAVTGRLRLPLERLITESSELMPAWSVGSAVMRGRLTALDTPLLGWLMTESRELMPAWSDGKAVIGRLMLPLERLMTDKRELIPAWSVGRAVTRGELTPLEILLLGWLIIDRSELMPA
jgi:hypothetical protein